MREDANLFGVKIRLMVQFVFGFEINNVMVHIVIDTLFLLNFISLGRMVLMACNFLVNA